MRDSLEAISPAIRDVLKRESLMPDQPAPKPVSRHLTLEMEQPNGNLTIVRCHGQLVSGLTDILYSKVRPMIQANKRIVLDLSDLTWMDSMGLGTLVGLYTSAKAAGCELQLLKIGKRVRELLGLTHLLDVFSIIGEHGVRL
jgi:anti-sigma B factor antagonist